MQVKKIASFTNLWILISIVSYFVISYDLNRLNFPKLMVTYTILFTGFLILLSKNKSNTTLLVSIAFLFRLVFLIAIPNLSDDFYRFIWDGRMIWNGLNPYLYLPENNPNIISEGALLYEGMGASNGSHYTCYPPVNQFAFLIPALFFAKNFLGSTIAMRVLLILADFGTFYYGRKLLQHFKIPEHKIFFYILNPFIIIEMTGNLHFEGFMLFLLAASLYYLFTQKWILSACFYALSVSVKLIPLLFLPLLFKKLGLKKSVLFYAIVGGINILLFIPFMSYALYENFMSSIHLYFQNFEFNASIYYVIREIGYHVKGYNIIKTVGKITPIIVIFSVLTLSFFKKNNQPKVLFTTMLFAITIYYSLASIVHPWYIAVPLFLSLFTNYRFPLVWSFFIILSYSAYRTAQYHENLYLVGLEYFCVFGYLIYELKLNSKNRIIV